MTISQELVMRAFGCPGAVFRPLELALSKTASSVVSQTLLEHLKISCKKEAWTHPKRRASMLLAVSEWRRLRNQWLSGQTISSI